MSSGSVGLSEVGFWRGGSLSLPLIHNTRRFSAASLCIWLSFLLLLLLRLERRTGKLEEEEEEGRKP